MQRLLKDKKIAFVVGKFPAISETWLINQIADLQEKGVAVDIFSFQKGDADYISERFGAHRMGERTFYVEMPRGKLARIARAVPKLLYLLARRPMIFLRVCNVWRHGKNAASLKLLFWVWPFVGREYALVHCHFGTIANKFLVIREILGMRQKIITTFYGYDVSHIFRQKGPRVYDALKKECELFFVMSQNMKDRVVAQGFDARKIHIMPISIDVGSYPFKERFFKQGETIQIVSVGRFVEKKGFDDLLRALAIVKNKAGKKFMCNIIGGGPLELRLRAMTKELGIEDVVSYKGYMKMENIINYFQDMHFYVQPSKTASGGDME
ncbi:glycosyltransferase [Candidatus Azambacteria bacterium]|nr:glycosyltransferase [Candidatus Azambacteria bacterium]